DRPRHLAWNELQRGQDEKGTTLSDDGNLRIIQGRLLVLERQIDRRRECKRCRGSRLQRHLTASAAGPAPPNVAGGGRVGERRETGQLVEVSDNAGQHPKHMEVWVRLGSWFPARSVP